jgi:hypothetical protein
MKHELRGRATAALFVDRPLHIRFAIYNRPAPFISSPSSISMSSLSLPSDTDGEGKSPGWRHWWDRAATPSSNDSPPPESDDSLSPDSEDEEEAEEEEEEDSEEEEEEDDAATRAKADAKAKTQPASTFDNEEDMSYSDASTDTASSEEVTSRKRKREDDEAEPSRKK